MKISKKIRIWSYIGLTIIIVSNFVMLSNLNYSNGDEIEESNINISSIDFTLTRDFSPSSYYISPESSLGEKDGVYFTFKANRNGNYTIDVINFPNSLTESVEQEYYASFHNPSGTDLYYISYIEFNLESLGKMGLNMLVSRDRGKSWQKSQVLRKNTNGTIFETMNTLLGAVIAAKPNTGVIGISTITNSSNLVFIGSENNGTSWKDPQSISSLSTFGGDQFLDFKDRGHPRMEMGIIKNGSILLLIQADNVNFTEYVYFQSDDNGTTWSLPGNITVLQNIEVVKLKIQTDLSSGDYWLAWKSWNDPLYVGSWAEFNSTHGLSSNVNYKNFSSDFQGNFDFKYDSYSNNFRILQARESPDLILNWTTPDFATNWTFTSFGDIPHIIPAVSQDSNYFEISHDGDKYQLIYTTHEITGLNDIFQYNYLENSTFWSYFGNFTAYELEQIFWDGFINGSISVPSSTVEVMFSARNGTEYENRSIYIIIDNIQPSFETYEQKLQYFNPLTSNLSLSEILWDILPSEEANVNLEIFRNETYSSDWIPVTDNNWDEKDPIIFISDTGQLYTVFQTFESGRKIIYIRRSLDKGITWSNPEKIIEYTFQNTADFYGVAKGDNVFILIQDPDPTSDDYSLYRSYDQGINFEEPINLNDIGFLPPSFAKISDIEISQNGTLFLSARDVSGNPWFVDYIYKSVDRGVTWTLMGQFDIFSNFSFSNNNIMPSLGYDLDNDLLHIVMPTHNSSFFFPHLAFGNFSYSTFNLSSNNWSSIYSTGFFSTGVFIQDPNMLITRNSQDDIIIRTIFMNDFYVEDGQMVIEVGELNSTDLGQTWGSPYESSVSTSFFTKFTSDLDDIYYITFFSDGNDVEVQFMREGRLVKNSLDSISSSNITEYNYDGIDDFGEYLTAGNYTFEISLKDDAGNQVVKGGWVYVDYDAPQISEKITNWTISPIPRSDVNVSVNITDGIGFSTFLYYKKDSGNWQMISMSNVGGNTFSAIIPGDNTTEQVQYYIRSIDLAGNADNLDNNGNFYSYDLPNYQWGSLGLFNESESYSSSDSYTFSVSISNDLQYIDKIVFRYSYDEGATWQEIEMVQNSPEFSATLEDIPGDLRELQYQIILTDVFGSEVELTSIQQIEFYPEIPGVTFEGSSLLFVMVISALFGFLVAYGYVRLKNTSHESMYRQIFLTEFMKKTLIGEDIGDLNDSKKRETEVDQEFQDTKISSPFSRVYYGVLTETLIVFIIGIYLSETSPQVGILLLAGSLLSAVFGYTILFSRDIAVDIYLEKIYKKNILLESFQITFMLVNIITILLVGYTIDWFRYYLIESTFNIGALSIPRLYISVIGVFFTSLVLVVITTYLQLKKTVKNLQDQRTQGATDKLLLYVKDQSSSRLITRLGYKTIVFLVTVLIGIVTTTNLLTPDVSFALFVILVPFVLSSFVALFLNRKLMSKSQKKEDKDIKIPFIDSKKECTKCGKMIYLTDKFCGICGDQQIFSEQIGTYIAKCPECSAHINSESKFCTSCSKNVSNLLSNSKN